MGFLDPKPAALFTLGMTECLSRRPFVSNPEIGHQPDAARARNSNRNGGMLMRKNRPPPITAMTIIIKTSACPRWPDCGRGIALLLCFSDEELVIFEIIGRRCSRPALSGRSGFNITATERRS